MYNTLGPSSMMESNDINQENMERGQSSQGRVFNIKMSILPDVSKSIDIKSPVIKTKKRDLNPGNLKLSGCT